jgi:hypothetical protein
MVADGCRFEPGVDADKQDLEAWLQVIRKIGGSLVDPGHFPLIAKAEAV